MIIICLSFFSWGFLAPVFFCSPLSELQCLYCSCLQNLDLTKWGPQLSQPITNSCQMQVISMQKVFNVNVLTFIRKCVTLVKATWDLGLTTLRMFGSPSAWLLNLFLALLHIQSSLETVAGSFRDMRAVGSARQSGAVEQALQDLQGQTGDVFVKGNPVRHC